MKRLILTLVMGFSIVVSASSAKSQDIELIKDLIKQQSTQIGVPTDFALALFKVESNYNPKVRGVRGEYGLGQILCSTAKSVGFSGKCSELVDPEKNIKYSLLYLKEALDLSGNNQCYAATLYSAGFKAKPRSSSYCKLVLKNM